MDAEYMEERRETISRSESRWSMNSQRVEEIVAELMRPIDKKRSFDTDLSALLEEYLTEAGLHALEADETGALYPTPNFAELALVLQQLASLYGVRVDFLYQHVISISISLHKHDQEENVSGTHGEINQEGSRRKRKASIYAVDTEAFCHIELDASECTTREAEPLRLPPRLPRHYLELEPRPLTDRDASLTDYAGECVGRLSDFHVAWRLQNGFLVDELEEATADATSMAVLRRPSFPELQAVIQAAASTVAPAAPSAVSTSDPISSPATPFLSPIVFSPTSPEPPLCETPQPLPSSSPLHVHERKRKLTENKTFEEVAIPFKINKRQRQRLLQLSDFNVPKEWFDNVVTSRCRLVLQLRRKLRPSFDATNRDFAGFYDSVHPSDMGSGFRGWSSAEIEMAHAAVEMAQTLVEGVRVESDDDGFFDQSSFGDCDRSSAPSGASSFPGDANSESWAREVAARAVAAADAGGVDVRAAGARVLATLKPERATSFINVLRSAATTLPDVSHLFLATLFLANEGSVRVVRGSPLTLGDFKLQLNGPARASTPVAALAAGT